MMLLFDLELYKKNSIWKLGKFVWQVEEIHINQKQEQDDSIFQEQHPSPQNNPEQ